MKENKKSFKEMFTKEVIISSVIGLAIGILIALLISYFMYGRDTMASVSGKSIKTQDVYENMKTNYGLQYLIQEVDKTILNEMYDLTEEEEEEVKSQAEMYVAYYESEEDFLEAYGYKDYEAFLDDIRASAKSDKYLLNYTASSVGEEAIENYYNENKDSLEKYDSEHILVKVSDTVTEDYALALANEIIGKLNEGKTFDEVVEEYKDQIVHENLGYQGKNASLEQTYIDELVALSDGAYSTTPIKTSYGYHIVHKIATSTLETAREDILTALYEDLVDEDAYVGYKAFIDLRKEKNLVIYDDTLKEQYDDYCDQIYATEE